MAIANFSEDLERWRERFDATPEREAAFSTLSGEPVRALYGPEDVGSFAEGIGFPDEFPFTRGVYPSMYRGRLWTMRQFAGFGTAEETNAHATEGEKVGALQEVWGGYTEVPVF
jgi:methylmalonyl-CoA mutase N-terminal domain/subunit